MSVTDFQPFWILDFDNDPNYEDNHNFGWVTVVEAPSHEEALKRVRAGARSASLLPEDITPDSVRRATAEDVAEFEWLGGSIF